MPAAGSFSRMRDLLRLPKANLHVHLEDAIRPRTVAENAASHDLRLPPGTPITDVALAGVRASFAPADLKAQLTSQIGAWLG